MTIPEDVETFLATLLQLSVDEALVAKAREILGHKERLNTDIWVRRLRAQWQDQAIVSPNIFASRHRTGPS